MFEYIVEIEKYNEHHDPKTGRFTNKPGGSASAMSDSERKEKQLAIIQQNNAMHDDYHTGIRNVSDILTAKEAFDEDEFGGTPDWEYEDAQRALESGEVTLYSSHPIENGAFVTPSQMMANDYAGGGKIHSKTVSVDSVAWINSEEGQFAPVEKSMAREGRKGHMDIDHIVEIEKFNPYHGPDGRFTTAGGATSFTIRTRAGYNQGMANRSIERAKEKHKQESAKKPEKREGTFREGAKYSNEYKVDTLKKWSRTGYNEVREGKTPEAKKMAEALEEVIRENPSVKGTIYRGINTKEDLRLKKGSEVDMDGLSSFTTERSVADDFSRYGGTGGGKYQYVFRAENVSQSADIARYSGLPQEREVLVSGNAKFKVKKITKNKKSGQIVVDIEEVAEAKKSLFNIMKSSDDKRLVFGWASIAIENGEQLEDMQHDMIDPDDLEEAAYEYVLKFRDTGEEHMADLRKKGKLVESCVFTEEKQQAMGLAPGTLPVGWWIGFYIEDDDAWERIKNGTYRMFSIEGKAERVPIDGESVTKCNEFDYIDDTPS